MGWVGKKPSEFMETVWSDFRQIYVDFATTAFTQIVAVSPIDTGAYSANHRVTVNFRDTGFDKGKTNRINALETGLATINSLPERFAGTLYIQNNAPYCVRLEYGHSKQASHIYQGSFEAAQAKHG